MFDNLLNLVKEHAGDAIINNPVIPNEKNEEAIQTTTTSIMDTLKSQAGSGNLGAITDLFSAGNAQGSGITSLVNSDVVKNLMGKFGIDSQQATSIASSLIPKVMDNLVKKTNDPNDKSFDLQGILGSLGGGNVSNVLGGLGKLFN